MGRMSIVYQFTDFILVIDVRLKHRLYYADRTALQLLLSVLNGSGSNLDPEADYPL